MVARLTPDQKVACSIHVGFNSHFFFPDFLIFWSWDIYSDGVGSNGLQSLFRMKEHTNTP